MIIETWTEEGHTYSVIRAGFESCSHKIMEAMRQLPPGAVLWESLAYGGETVELVFRAPAVQQRSYVA